MSDLGGGASRSTDPASGTSSATDVSLREFVGQAIGYERIINRVLVGGLAALGIYSWTEVQRRLTNLNHESDRITAAQAASVSADTYRANEEQRKKEAEELRVWRKEQDTARNQSVNREEYAKDARGEKRAGIDTTTKVIGAAAVAVIVLLGILNYQALHRTPMVVTPTVTTAPSK